MTSTSSAIALATPISVSTSQGWDNDGAGKWSTFVVQLGTPAQVSRVMVSTAGDETWVVLNAGCPTNYGSTCASDRGGIFGVANSTSWKDIALYELSLELNLGYTGNGQFGYDTVSLGYPTSGGPTVLNSVVAGLATPNYWLGQFGLDPAPSNFSTLNDPQPSFLWNLRNQSMIPSTSWGYTAGASYRYNKIQGSLTLGGYDTSRFGPKNVTFDFYNDVSRRFLADLRSITYIPSGVTTTTTSTTLMSQSIPMYIDSTIPYMYLPLTICNKFESAFGLTWNSTTELYTVNDTAHASLLSTNPTLTFTLANTAGQTLDINLPYASFDLQASFPVLPYGSNATNYFPLKRATNDTQYTLGRVFLQETYLIADYDRAEFTLAPCVWPSSFEQNIIAIYPPSTITNTTLPPTTSKSNSTPLGAIIGSVIGGIVLIVLACLAYYHFIHKPRRHRTRHELEAPLSSLTQNTTNTYSPRPITSGTNVQDKPELPADLSHAELSAWDEAEKKRVTQAEVDGTMIRGYEMGGGEGVGSELDGGSVFEMPAREPVGSEMGSPVVGGRSPLSVGSVSRDSSRDPGVGGGGGRRERRHETYYNP